MRPYPQLATISFLGLLFATVLTLSGCGNKTSKVTFETSPVQAGDLTQYVTASGSLNAVASVDVGSQISGSILALNADFNSPVKKGEVIAEIDPAVYKAAVGQAKGDLESAKSARELAKITLERERGLVGRKAAPQSDLDKAEAECRQADAMVDVKTALLDKANADLEHCRICAPVDGVVVARKVDVGQTVAAVMTTPVLFTVAQDLTKMRIIANVSEADIGQVAQDQPVEFTVDAFPDEVFKGKVSQVRRSPTTTENVVTYDVVIDVANLSQKLFPGMTAEVSILVAKRTGILTIPNAALRFTPPEGTKFESASETASSPTRTQRVVYLPNQDGSALKAVSLKIGITDGVRSEVVDGVKEGMQVVTATNAPAAKTGGFGPPPP